MEGIIILGILVIAVICFFRSDFWWNLNRKWEREAKEAEEERRASAFESSAIAFSETLVSNQTIIAISDVLYKKIINNIVGDVEFATVNRSRKRLVLAVEGGSICSDVEFEYTEYTPDHKKAISDRWLEKIEIRFSDYKIQTISEQYKIYGMAIALRTLLKPLLVKASIPNVKDIELALKSDILGKRKMVLTYTIEQNKYIEL